MAKGAFGLEVKLGDDVCYPGRQGSSLWLNRGTIVHDGGNFLIINRKNQWDDAYKDVRVTNLNMVVPLPINAE